MPEKFDRLKTYTFVNRWKRKTHELRDSRVHQLLVDLDENCTDEEERGRPISFDVGRHGKSGFQTTASARRHTCRCRCWRQFREGRWTIIPEPVIGQITHWMDLWDIFVWWTTLFTVFYVPYDVVFYKRETNLGSAIHCVLNLIFTTDMLLVFSTAYKLSPDSASAKHLQLWMLDPLEIAWRYIKPVPQDGYKSGWFLADLLCVFPGWYEWVVISSATGSDQHLQSLRCWSRLALVLRFLAPLAHPILGKRTRWDRLVERIHISYGQIFLAIARLVNFVTMTGAICHCMACTWIAVEGHAIDGLITYSSEAEVPTWLTQLISIKGNPCSSNSDGIPDNFCYYTIALYWAWTTLSSVGYGDIIPMNYAEYIVCTVAIVISFFLSAYVIGSFASLLSSLMDKHSQQLDQDLRILDKMLDSRAIAPDLKTRVRGYMYRSEEVVRLRDQTAFLENHRLSHALQCEMAQQTLQHNDLWASVWWASSLNSETMLDMTRLLYPEFYGPHEDVVSNGQFMLIMRSGLSAYRGHVLVRGNAWGLDSILLTSPGLIDRSPLKMLSYSDALQLKKIDLQFICHQHPMTDAALRRVQIRTAVRRAVILVAQFLREGQNLEQAQAQILDHDQRKHFRTRSESIHSLSPITSQRKASKLLTKKASASCEFPARGPSMSWGLSSSTAVHVPERFATQMHGKREHASEKLDLIIEALSRVEDAQVDLQSEFHRLEERFLSSWGSS